MRIGSWHLGHDAAYAVIEDGVLACSIEVEKIGGNPRYASLQHLVPTEHRHLAHPDQMPFAIDAMNALAEVTGHPMETLDQLVVNGYDNIAGEGLPGRQIAFPPYLTGQPEALLAPVPVSLPGGPAGTQGYSHVGGHVAAAYAASPFAQAGEPAYILVWDGGIPPLLYRFCPGEALRAVGVLFPVHGLAYGLFALRAGPYTGHLTSVIDNCSIAGKAMALVALGTANSLSRDAFRRVYEDHESAYGDLFAEAPLARHTYEFCAALAGAATALQMRGEDAIAACHHLFQGLLLERTAELVEKEHRSGPRNLCLVGGCALNIKWNSALRDQGLFDDLFVPPFASDSGSAIGGACAAMMQHEKRYALDWSVYAGPKIRQGLVPDTVTQTRCDTAGLAEVLHRTGDPVVVLNGAAEIGPRALGNRSILAPATNPAIKETLNGIKKREWYRPVAPICLENQAQDVFDPGTPDPYMLFEHRLRSGWAGKVPGICHLDGTARLQTVNATQNPLMFELLSHYAALSGIPLLCNTSANDHGRGFFPDVASALAWGKVRHVWSEGILYERPT